jgi:hypothetical protein
MREESHLDEMRDAIRGDFERLAERRGEQELMRTADPADPPGPLESSEEEDETDDERRSWLWRVFSA